MIDSPESRTVSTVIPVSLLISSARLILERSLPLNWVSGEISNFTRAPSGHCYFMLKDDKAQVRCVFYRHRAVYTDLRLLDGMQVEVRALATIYEARGEFQLNVEAVRLAGKGAFYEAFARLKAKLEVEGLFAAAHKRPLPAFPQRVGVVTSTRAAALRDVLATLKRRMPGLPVIVYPCAVQGQSACEEVAAAIRRANASRQCDVLIVCRGGGSIEDLWGFNEESVARAIFASVIPIVSGVGHETDFTICDFVADVRAATPTAAAMMVVPDRVELDARLRGAFLRVRAGAVRGLEQVMQRVDQLASRLRHPASRLAEQQRAVARLALRLSLAWKHEGEHAATQLANARARLVHRLRIRLPQADTLAGSEERFQRAQMTRWRALAQRLDACERALAHLNPRAVLERGYSIVLTEQDAVVQSSEQLEVGERLRLQFARGSAHATVEALMRK